MTKQDNQAKEQARAQIDNIVAMLRALDIAERNGIVTYYDDDYDADGMRELIEQDALSVQVRGNWYTPANNDSEVVEYNILLCTGGPAVRIIGELGQYNEPETSQVQYQDWFEPWTDYLETTRDEDAAILRYCCMFWYN